MEADEFPSLASILPAATIGNIKNSLVVSPEGLLENCSWMANHPPDELESKTARERKIDSPLEDVHSGRSTTVAAESSEIFPVKDIYTESERLLRENPIELAPLPAKKTSVFDVISRLRRENSLKKIENERLANIKAVPNEMKSRPKLTADCNTSSPILEIERMVKTAREETNSKIEYLDKNGKDLKEDDCLIVIEDVAARPAALAILENFSKKKLTLDRLNEDLKQRREKQLLQAAGSEENLPIDNLVDKDILSSTDITLRIDENKSLCEEAVNIDHDEVYSELGSDEYEDDKLDDVLQDNRYEDDDNEDEEDSLYTDDDSQTVKSTGTTGVIISEDDMQSGDIMDDIENSAPNPLTSVKRVSTRIADSDDSENDHNKFPSLTVAHDQPTDSLIPESNSLIQYLSGQFSSAVTEQQRRSRFVDEEAEEEDELGNVVDSMDMQEEKNIDQEKVLQEIRGMIDDRNTTTDATTVKELFLKQNLEEDFEEADELLDLLSRRKKQRNEEKELRRIFLARRQASINSADRNLGLKEQRNGLALESIKKYDQDGNVDPLFEERTSFSHFNQKRPLSNPVIEPNIYFERSSGGGFERDLLDPLKQNLSNRGGVEGKRCDVVSSPSMENSSSFSFSDKVPKDNLSLGFNGSQNLLASTNLFSLYRSSLLDKPSEHLDHLQEVYSTTYSGNAMFSTNNPKAPGVYNKKKMGFIAMSMHHSVSNGSNLKPNSKFKANNPS